MAATLSTHLPHLQSEIFGASKTLTTSLLSSSLSLSRHDAQKLLLTLLQTDDNSTKLTPHYTISGVDKKDGSTGRTTIATGSAMKDEVLSSLTAGSTCEIYAVSPSSAPSQLSSASIEFEDVVRERMLMGESTLVPNLEITNADSASRKKRVRGAQGIGADGAAYKRKKTGGVEGVQTGSGSGGFASNSKSRMSAKPQNTKEFFGGKGGEKSATAPPAPAPEEEEEKEKEEVAKPKKSIFASSYVPKGTAKKQSSIFKSSSTKSKSVKSKAAKSAPAPSPPPPKSEDLRRR